jgi:hypothetical protein
MMKMILGIFLAGAFTAYLLDPTSGRDRRLRGVAWARPLGRRVRQAKERVADSDTFATVRESAAPALSQTLKDAATTVRGGVVDASSAFVSRAGRAVGIGSEGPEADDAQGEVAPKPGIDPIPEGEPNDPTLVSRVESELFRDKTLPKGSLNIDAANGVVTLRGSLDGQAQADEIVERTRAIEGVAEVVDLLRRP